MKTLITGVAGTGKTTIARALREKGIFAVDFSEVPLMCFWQNEKGEKVEYSPVHSREWFLMNKRICGIDKLKEIITQQEDVVMTGVASGNIEEYVPLFDRIILLQCSPYDLVQRLQTRDNPSNYGKTSIEQEDNIEWQKEFDPKILSYGAIPINTEGDINNVVENILKVLKDN